jgi:hypothetical protein
VLPQLAYAHRVRSTHSGSPLMSAVGPSVVWAHYFVWRMVCCFQGNVACSRTCRSAKSGDPRQVLPAVLLGPSDTCGQDQYHRDCKVPVEVNQHTLDRGFNSSWNITGKDRRTGTTAMEQKSRSNLVQWNGEHFIIYSRKYSHPREACDASTQLH